MKDRILQIAAALILFGAYTAGAVLVGAAYTTAQDRQYEKVYGANVSLTMKAGCTMQVEQICPEPEKPRGGK